MFNGERERVDRLVGEVNEEEEEIKVDIKKWRAKIEPRHLMKYVPAIDR